jgi:hypothetical protein
MVVEAKYTIIAKGAMLRTCWSIDFASAAPFAVNFNSIYNVLDLLRWWPFSSKSTLGVLPRNDTGLRARSTEEVQHGHKEEQCSRSTQHQAAHRKTKSMANTAWSIMRLLVEHWQRLDKK